VLPPPGRRRPTGLPLLAVNGGYATGSAGVKGSTFSATVLRRGGAFIGTLWTGSPLPLVSTMGPTTMEQYRWLGGSTGGSRLPSDQGLQMTGLALAVPYETDLSTLDLSSSSFIPYVGAGMPVLELRQA